MDRVCPYLTLATLGLLSGCASSNAPSSLPRGPAAYRSLAPAAADVRADNYRIGTLDTLDISVFQEPDLSSKAVQVDAAGNISLPLIGTVPAAGLTASQFSRALEQRLGTRYLEHPQVTVSVASSVSQKVVVQGEVTEPGVYDIKGGTTLLEALSRAKGETRVAALKQVTVFRTVSGQRMGAVFDVAAIRRGDASDPEVVGNDVIIVGYSPARGAWRDLLLAAPLLNVFRPF